MGSTTNSNEQPVHIVTVPTFKMMRSEVTIGMYRACVVAGACSALSTSSGRGRRLTKL